MSRFARTYLNIADTPHHSGLNAGRLRLADTMQRHRTNSAARDLQLGPRTGLADGRRPNHALQPRRTSQTDTILVPWAPDHTAP